MEYMKHAPIVIAIAVIFFSSISGADCSLKVATAAGRYLAALEQAKLTKYQNNSVCEVLELYGEAEVEIEVSLQS